MTLTLIPGSDTKKTVKFLYSYGGKILPRRSDGKLRYVGGLTRVLSVPRSISYAELMVKLGELCGSSMSLKCKLPNEDLDVLISITSDEDLKNVISEYSRSSKEEKIVAVLFRIKSLKKLTPVSSVEDLCSSGSSATLSSCRAPPAKAVAYSSRATCHHLCQRGVVYGHRGISPRNMCAIPSSYYAR